MSVTPNPAGQWLYDTTLPINNELLNAAKSLLRCIYATGDGPDYLPMTYTNCDQMLTQYITHASHPTGVNWSDSFSWASAYDEPIPPAGSSFSGTVVAGPASAGVGCWTDCSGFITALFAWVNLHAGLATVFPYWAIGQKIPEAGCYARNQVLGTGDETWPNKLNFYHLTNHASGTTPPDQFQSIALEDIEPGDLVVFASGNERAGDTGHIMLIAAVMPVEFGGSYFGGDVLIPVGPAGAGTPRLLSVIDQTEGRHGLDCRGDGKMKTSQNIPGLATGRGIGVGMGLILLYMDQGQIQFRWSTNLNGTLETVNGGAVVLARALAVSA